MARTKILFMKRFLFAALVYVSALGFLVGPRHSAASQISQSTCDWLRSIAVEWSKPRQPSATAQKLFRQCAIELASPRGLQTSMGDARDIFAPHLLPRAMRDEVVAVQSLYESHSFKMLKTAEEHTGRQYAAKVRQSAISWLKQIRLAEGPCMLPAMHYMGRLGLFDNMTELVDQIDAEAYLRIAANMGYPPAGRDFGAYQLSSRKYAGVRAISYGHIIFAKNAGEDVDHLLKKFQHALTPLEIDVAHEIASDMPAMDPPTSYLDCLS